MRIITELLHERKKNCSFKGGWETEKFTHSKAHIKNESEDFDVNDFSLISIRLSAMSKLSLSTFAAANTKRKE